MGRPESIVRDVGAQPDPASPPLKRLRIGAGLQRTSGFRCRSPEFGDLRPGRRDEFCVRAGVSVQTPATLGRLGKQDPRAFGEGCIAGRVGHDRRELGNDRQLLVTVERSGIGEDLDSNVGAVAINVRDRGGGQLVDERAVFCRNIGMSGTRSTVITAVARSRASVCVSENVPAAA